MSKSPFYAMNLNNTFILIIEWKKIFLKKFLKVHFVIYIIPSMDKLMT